MRRWKTEALPAGCLDTAEQLKPFPWLKSFYLAGGTALALMYGHRISVDFDFFSAANALGFTDRQPVVKSMRAIGGEIEEEKDGTIQARYQNIHVSFFRYLYPVLRPLRKWRRLSIASPIDIGLMKIGAIIGRGSKKDFVDLYVILKNEIPLARLLRLAPKKFPGSRDFSLQAFRALVYFVDAEEEPELAMLRRITWPEIKAFFETEVRRLARQSFK